MTQPPDGHTYNCARFPPQWNASDAAGVKKIADPAVAVATVDQFIGFVYESTPAYVRERDPGACDMEAMSSLQCERWLECYTLICSRFIVVVCREEPWRSAPWSSRIDHQPIRGVNIAGLFVLERWILPDLIEWGDASGITDHYSFSKRCSELGICDKLKDHLLSFYSQADFDAMKTYGLNSVRIPIGYWYFSELSRVAAESHILPDESILDAHHPLTRVIGYAKQSGLMVILTLEKILASEINSSESTASVVMATASAMAFYISSTLPSLGLDNVIILELNLPESEDRFDRLEEQTTALQTLRRVREIDPSLPLLVLETSYAPISQIEHVYINTKVFHGLEVSDIASDSAASEREKMFAHEKIACGFKAPLHFTTCTRAPTLVGEFSLAIDNCMPHIDPNFANFGKFNIT